MPKLHQINSRQQLHYYFMDFESEARGSRRNKQPSPVLVHLMLDPEGEQDADIGRDNEVVDNG